MFLKVAVCDDDPNVCNELSKKIISYDPNVDIMVFSDGAEIIRSDKEFDIYFLDIDMPKVDGMKTAEIIRQRSSDAFIFFLTSHFEYIREAFKVRAYRYLVKPLSESEFTEAFMSAVNEIVKKQRIIIKTEKGSEMVSIDDIVLLEAFGDGTYIYTKKDVKVGKEPLKNILDVVGNSFFRTHKSYAVALSAVKTICNSEIEMNYTDVKVPISRRKIKPFKERLFEYVRLNARAI